MKTWHWLLIGGAAVYWFVLRKPSAASAANPLAPATTGAQQVADAQLLASVANALQLRLQQAGVQQGPISTTWTGTEWNFIDQASGGVLLKAKDMADAQAQITAMGAGVTGL